MNNKKTHSEMKHRTLFIVDDDPMLSEMLADDLQEAFPDLRVKTFATGEECLAHLQEKPDLVVLDYYLNTREKEASNGIDILRQIKGLNKALPVIMLSSQKRYAVAAHSIVYGAIHYVIKSQTAFGEIRDIVRANLDL